MGGEMELEAKGKNFNLNELYIIIKYEKKRNFSRKLD